MHGLPNRNEAQGPQPRRPEAGDVSFAGEDAEPDPAAEREPLPPGHPDSWGALIAGTLLEGTAYPLPVFDR